VSEDAIRRFAQYKNDVLGQLKQMEDLHHDE
jgi:hypothetical protein